MSEISAAAGTAAAQQDQVRAETLLPLAAAAAFEFVADIERLLRLNPHLAVETWQPMPDGVRFAAQNETSGLRIETMVRVETTQSARTVVLSYAAGLKQATTLAVEAAEDGGCRLVITEHYPIIMDAQDPRVAEVDRSLVPWIDAIHRHLLGRRRWGRLPGWRWWHESFLPGMAPRQRRIVRMIVWVGVLEFVVFVFVAAIFWAERRGG